MPAYSKTKTVTDCMVDNHYNQYMYNAQHNGLKEHWEFAMLLTVHCL